jgi:hypothetical protein
MTEQSRSDLDLEAQARATWDAALASSEPGFVDQARRELRAAGMVFHDEDAVRVARPMLLSRSHRDHDQESVSAVTAALAAATQAVLDDRALSRRYLGDLIDGGPLESLIRLDPGYSTPVVFGRFDGARVGGRLRMIEFNGGLPGGVYPSDTTSRLMSTWPAADAVRRQTSLEVPHVAPALLGAVVSAWQEFGGSGLPVTAVAMPSDLAGAFSGGLQHVVAGAAAFGVDIAVADPGEFRYEGGRLRLADRTIDVLVRAFVTSSVPALGGRIDAITAAVEAGDLCLITSFRSGLLGHKALFALATDPAYDLGLSEEVRARAADCLPWTRVVAAGPTTDREGEATDLLSLALREQQDLVLKPAFGYGGAGVTLGWERSPEQWDADVRSALGQGGWILQERVNLDVEEYPQLIEGFPRRSYAGDINPFVCFGSVAGYFVRLAAQGGITNLTSGDGSVTGTLILG